ncbi:MAG: endonuclease domain-containing protein [Candidatus Eisenbacteria bacterium]|nr:endonuclease domain-containing protein [Candidatus Eisenbacteria bacterium]
MSTPISTRRSRTGRARSLRRRSTDAERALWRRLRGRQLAAGLKFRRQCPIGPYTADFFCQEARLVVEVDGSQHTGSRADETRDEWMTAQGFRILRFWDNDVLLRADSVLETIRVAARSHE